MKQIKKDNASSLEITHLTPQQQNTINLLNKQIQPAIENYLDINFSSGLLENTFRKSYELFSFELLKALFVLSLTDNYDSDLRRRMIIYVEVEEFFNWITQNFNERFSIKIQQYTFRCVNFIFLAKIPNLTHLNLDISYFEPEIDTSPLVKVESIGDNFMLGCYNLKNLDLSNLTSLTSLGNNFMEGCSSLTSISLPLTLTSLSSGFINKCDSLTSINLSNLTNLTSLENNFMLGCSTLTSIRLPKNLKTLGSEFMKGCTSLTSISLPPNLITLGNNFMFECSSLKSISLPPTLTSIGDVFMLKCYSLNNLDLSNLTSLTTIGVGFMYECTSLTSIHLPKNLISIGSYFMNNSKLKKIDFSYLTSLTTLGDNFMYDCYFNITINNSNMQIFDKYKENHRLKFNTLISIMHLLKKK